MTVQIGLLILIAVLIVVDCIVKIRSDSERQEDFDDYADELMNWIASMSMAIVLIQRKLCDEDGAEAGTNDPQEAEPTSNDLYLEGIQNILDYGIGVARKRRGDVE